MICTNDASDSKGSQIFIGCYVSLAKQWSTCRMWRKKVHLIRLFPQAYFEYEKWELWQNSPCYLFIIVIYEYLKYFHVGNRMYFYCLLEVEKSCERFSVCFEFSVVHVVCATTTSATYATSYTYLAQYIYVTYTYTLIRYKYMLAIHIEHAHAYIMRRLRVCNGPIGAI